MIAYQELRQQRETALARPSAAGVAVTIQRHAGTITAEQRYMVSINTERPDYKRDIRQSTWLTHVVQEAVGLLQLEPNWNGHGARPVSVEYLEEGLKTLIEILRPDSLPPRVFPTASGGVNFSWTTPRFNIEVGSEPGEGTVVSYEDVHGNEWDGPAADLPDLVEAALKQLAV